MNEIKIDYYVQSEAEIARLDPNKKPKLLLHSCCGPCACFPLTYLCPHFDVTIYYGNSNIFPMEEYARRLEELKKLLGDLEKDYGFHVDLIIPEYDYDGYMKDLRQYPDIREGGTRCVLCYTKRMAAAYDYAEVHGFDYFTTVMTISRQKNSQIMNRIGSQLEALHSNTKYLYSDFKKRGGIEKGRQMRLKYNLYNQLYCGCEFSYNGAQERLKRQEEIQSDQEGK